MAITTLLDSPVWKQFTEAARRRHEVPEDLVTAWIRECLEVWEDEALDNEIADQAQQSSLQEDDAVELIRRYRQEQRPDAAP